MANDDKHYDNHNDSEGVSIEGMVYDGTATRRWAEEFIKYDDTLYVSAYYKMKLNICPDEALGRAPQKHVGQGVPLGGDTRGMHDNGNLFYFFCVVDVCPWWQQGLDGHSAICQHLFFTNLLVPVSAFSSIPIWTDITNDIVPNGYICDEDFIEICQLQWSHVYFSWNSIDKFIDGTKFH